MPWDWVWGSSLFACSRGKEGLRLELAGTSSSITTKDEPNCACCSPLESCVGCGDSGTDSLDTGFAGVSGEDDPNGPPSGEEERKGGGVVSLDGGLLAREPNDFTGEAILTESSKATGLFGGTEFLGTRFEVSLPER